MRLQNFTLRCSWWGFVDDITVLLREKNEVVAEMAKKVMKKLKEEFEKKGLKLSVTENGKEEKSKMIASCGFLDSYHRVQKKANLTLFSGE